MSSSELDEAWKVGIFDAHCHPTDIMASMQEIGTMKARVLTVMATRAQDQHLVAEAAEQYPLSAIADVDRTDIRFIVPAFGWHPWFSHQMYIDDEPPSAKAHYQSVLTPSPEQDEQFIATLPAPRSLSQYLQKTQEYLDKFPLALVGEIGIDRGFRVPRGEEAEAGDISQKTGGRQEGEHTPGSREGRPLTPYRVDMNHQKKVLKAQFEMAGRHGRAVSVHSVQSHGVIFDILSELWRGHERPSKREQRKRAKELEEFSGTHESEDKILPFPPRVCMHSYSGPEDALKRFLAPSIPSDMFFSFSSIINFSEPMSPKIFEVIKAVPDDKLLIESDLHCAGDQMDTLLENILVRVCEIKHWDLKHGAEVLRQNWQRFVFGIQ